MIRGKNIQHYSKLIVVPAIWYEDLLGEIDFQVSETHLHAIKQLLTDTLYHFHTKRTAAGEISCIIYRTEEDRERSSCIHRSDES